MGLGILALNALKYRDFACLNNVKLLITMPILSKSRLYFRYLWERHEYRECICRLRMFSGKGLRAVPRIQESTYLKIE